MEYHRLSTTSQHCAFKISIVGCGNVGATIAYALLLDGTTTELTLINHNLKKAQGLMLDLEHSLPFTSYTKLEASDDYAACSGSNIVIVTAGKKQEPGETRLDLANSNKEIFKEIIPKIAKAAPNAILIVIANPLDVLTYQALQLSGFPENRVFGTGTILDSARFRFHISEILKIHPRSIDTYILGEHGDSSFPVLSSANVMGKPLFEFPGFTKEVAKKCYLDTKNAAYRIINDMGFTCYSIATAMLHLSKAIFEDTHEVFTVSTLLKDYYGYSNICLSIPAVIGRQGVVQTIEAPLDNEEQRKLATSVKTIKEFL